MDRERVFGAGFLCVALLAAPALATSPLKGPGPKSPQPKGPNTAPMHGPPLPPHMDTRPLLPKIPTPLEYPGDGEESEAAETAARITVLEVTVERLAEARSTLLTERYDLVDDFLDAPAGAEASNELDQMQSDLDHAHGQRRDAFHAALVGIEAPDDEAAGRIRAALRAQYQQDLDQLRAEFDEEREMILRHHMGVRDPSSLDAYDELGTELGQTQGDLDAARAELRILRQPPD